VFALALDELLIFFEEVGETLLIVPKGYLPVTALYS
jgi:hypothetical protein